MKKNLLFSALFLISASALAKSSVTLYGTVDAGLSYQNTTRLQTLSQGNEKLTGHNFAWSTNGKNKTKIGLKGQHEFGIGLDGIFQMELGLNLGDGTSQPVTLLNGFVGFKSINWGTVTVGQQTNAFDTLSVGSAMDGLGIVNYFDGTTGADLKPGIKYLTPEFLGLQLGLSWSGKNTRTPVGFGAPDKTESSNAYSVGLSYKLFGVNVSTGYYQKNLRQNGKDSTQRSWGVDANYQASHFSLYGQYTYVSAGSDLVGYFKPVIDGDNPVFHLVALGVSAPLGDQSSVHLEWQYALTKQKASGNAINLGLEHTVTEGLTVYAAAAYSHIKNKSDKRYRNDSAVKAGLSYDF